jgi:hypothetical protein
MEHPPGTRFGLNSGRDGYLYKVLVKRMARTPALLTRQREELAWELRVRGLREQRIAEEIEKAGLGRITQQAVSCMLIRLEARALEAMQERVGGVKIRQTDALWLIYNEAMQAWERSKQAHKSLARKVADDGQPSGAGTLTLSDQDGDPRFLNEARAALADIRKIWGLDAPSKFAPTSPDGKEEYGKLTDEQRALGLRNLLATLGDRGFGPLAERNGDAQSPLVDGPGSSLPGGGS